MNVLYIIVAINVQKDADNDKLVLYGYLTTLSCIMVLIGGLTLISASRELQAHSYPMLADTLLGKTGKRFVEFLTLVQGLLEVSWHVMVIDSILNPSSLLWLELMVATVLLLLTLIRHLCKLSFNYITGNMISFALVARALYFYREYSTPSVPTVAALFASFECFPYLLGIKRLSDYETRERFHWLFTTAVVIQAGIMVALVSLGPL